MFTGVRVILKEQDGVFTFTIPNVTEDDAAEYTCVAKNDSGSDVTNCRLTVQGKLFLYFVCVILSAKTLR